MVKWLLPPSSFLTDHENEYFCFVTIDKTVRISFFIAFAEDLQEGLQCQCSRMEADLNASHECGQRLRQGHPHAGRVLAAARPAAFKQF